MANSVKPGVHGTHHHHHRKHVHPTAAPTRPMVPPKTPGPEGHNDASSPWYTTLLGATSHVTGFRDWADHTLHDVENWWNHTLGTIGKHPQTGQPVAAGSPPAIAPVGGEVALEDAKTMGLRISTAFEGGISMNFQALADNRDKQGMSFGIIQWNFGRDTLGPLLNKMRAANADKFDACFGPDSDYDTLKTALANNRSADQKAWAIKLQGSATGKAAWKAAFKALGAIPEFNEIQRTEALAKYFPAVQTAVKELRGLKPDLMARVEFRSYAALFDVSIQQGGIDKKKWDDDHKHVLADCFTNIQTRVLAEKPATQLDLMKIVVTERAKMGDPEWEADVLSRRLSILAGKPVTSSEGTAPKPVTRTNPQYGLIGQYGTKNVTGL